MKRPHEGQALALHIEGLSVRRGRQQVLRGLDLELRPGEVVALLGRNGAGKSTLLWSALGLLPRRAGHVRIGATDPVDPARRGRAGRRARERALLVPDAPDVPRWMTPTDLCRYLAPQYPRWDAALANRALETMEVPTATRFGSLSRGNATKALLAAALAARPEVLLLDEPFANLDPLSREELQRGLLRELSSGAATLIATHELESTARLSDRIAVLADGRITQDVETEAALVEHGGATHLAQLLCTEAA